MGNDTTKNNEKRLDSLIQNLAILTQAELSLALILLRHAGPNGSAKISDADWQSWTGLAPQSKKYAALGLKNKGLLIEHSAGGQVVYMFRTIDEEIASRPFLADSDPFSNEAREKISRTEPTATAPAEWVSPWPPSTPKSYQEPEPAPAPDDRTQCCLPAPDGGVCSRPLHHPGPCSNRQTCGQINKTSCVIAYGHSDICATELVVVPAREDHHA
jgi:hypothetical protein